MTVPSDTAGAVVQILAPTGRDSMLLQESLQGVAIEATRCTDFQQLLAGLNDGAGAAIIAQEALDADCSHALISVLDSQEPWSDVPILLLSYELSKKTPQSERFAALFERANVTLLQRPLRRALLLSAVRAALRARRRQYEMRALHSELERALQLADMFISILGHDLRGPLAAIRISSEVIGELPNDNHARKSLEIIRASADRMGQMIDQLLDLAWIRQGHGIRLRPALCDLTEMSRQVVQEVGSANPQATIALSAQGNLVGCWDNGRLGQVISNLVGNAVQHGMPGRPITVELDGRDAAAVHMTVANFGAIPAHMLPYLFEPFKHAARGRARGEGLGLGLFIAREIVHAHGGEITVTTTDQQRTIFDLRLPREAARQGDDDTAVPLAAQDSYCFGKA